MEDRDVERDALQSMVRLLYSRMDGEERRDVEEVIGWFPGVTALARRALGDGWKTSVGGKTSSLSPDRLHPEMERLNQQIERSSLQVKAERLAEIAGKPLRSLIQMDALRADGVFKPRDEEGRAVVAGHTTEFQRGEYPVRAYIRPKAAQADVLAYLEYMTGWVRRAESWPITDADPEADTCLGELMEHRDRVVVLEAALEVAREQAESGAEQEKSDDTFPPF